MRWGIMDVDGREEEEAAINETHTCTVEGEGIKWTDTCERERETIKQIHIAVILKYPTLLLCLTLVAFQLCHSRGTSFR